MGWWVGIGWQSHIPPLLRPIVDGSRLRLCLDFISVTAQLLLDVGQLIRANHKGVVSEELDNKLQGWPDLGWEGGGGRRSEGK